MLISCLVIPKNKILNSKPNQDGQPQLTRNKAEVGYLNGGPTKLKNDDEGGVIKEARQIGSDVEIGVTTWQTRNEDEGEGQSYQYCPQQMPTCHGKKVEGGGGSGGVR